jgi:thiosulfate/3-mercaptopyruvate sulfurtransferase
VVLTLDAAGLGAHTALLDGGMPAWVKAGQPVTDVAPAARTGKLAPLAMRPIIVDAATVVARLGKPGFAVVDARKPEYYSGDKTGGMWQHPHRAGHIAGALTIPFDSVFDDHNALRAPDDLRARFTRAGVRPGDTVIGYCHIGQQATAMLFAARRLGHTVLLYDGSFEDWSAHAAYPVETTAKGAKP